MPDSKICIKCEVDKSLSEFAWATRARDKVRYQKNICGDCERAYQKEYYAAHKEQLKTRSTEWRQANRERSRKYMRDYSNNRESREPGYKKRTARKAVLAQYGLTPEDYNQMVRDQDGKCAICGNEPGDTDGVDRFFLVVDHDHVSGKNRNLLCDFCNRGLGIFKDDPDLLIAAAMYLAQHKEVVSDAVAFE